MIWKHISSLSLEVSFNIKIIISVNLSNRTLCPIISKILSLKSFILVSLVTSKSISFLDWIVPMSFFTSNF